MDIDGKVWYCHCCMKCNQPNATKCIVCGRSPEYANPAYLPVHGSGAEYLRGNQVTTVLDRESIHDTTNIKWTALHTAASIGNADLVRELIRQESVVDAKTEQGQTPLHLAAHSGSVECASLLISNGADINAKTLHEENTPLHIAIKENWRAMTQFLVDVGADINTVDAVKRTPLHVACAVGRADIVSYLIKKGAKTNLLDMHDWEARQIAEFHGHYEIQEMLVRQNMKESQHTIRVLPPGRWSGPLWEGVVTAHKNDIERLHKKEEVEKRQSEKLKRMDSSINRDGEKLDVSFYDKNGVWNPTRRKRILAKAGQALIK